MSVSFVDQDIELLFTKLLEKLHPNLSKLSCSQVLGTNQEVDITSSFSIIGTATKEIDPGISIIFSHCGYQAGSFFFAESHTGDYSRVV